jgi:hypothetical protein
MMVNALGESAMPGFRSVALACTALVLAAPAGAALADPPSYEISPIGAPLSEGKLVFNITITRKGKKITRQVTIPKGDIKAAAPVDCTGLTDDDCFDKKANALAEASQAKSKVIAAAINEAFKNDFTAKFKATTGLKVGKVRVTVNGKVKVIEVPLGAVVIPFVTEKQGNPFEGKENGINGEGGNGGVFHPPPPKTTPGSKGKLERLDPGVETMSTGVDATGDTSYVQFGISEMYVGEVDPSAGMTDDQVLSALVSDLNSHGLSASFDAGGHALLLNTVIPDGDTLIWGNTDTGLNFGMSQVGVGTPEPGTWAMLLLGLGGLGALARSRRRAQPVTSRY